jgi:hypothetical protein
LDSGAGGPEGFNRSLSADPAVEFEWGVSTELAEAETMEEELFERTSFASLTNGCTEVARPEGASMVFE